jgi:hypothetical protein
MNRKRRNKVGLLHLSAPRLKKALKRAKCGRHDECSLDGWTFSVRDLRETLQRRGMPDREIHKLFFVITHVLEPEPCRMTHCKDYGGEGCPMNCALERVPGRCQVYAKYKKRREERLKKVGAA